jgi:hypothetical protein
LHQKSIPGYEECQELCPVTAGETWFLLASGVFRRMGNTSAKKRGRMGMRTAIVILTTSAPSPGFGDGDEGGCHEP